MPRIALALAAVVGLAAAGAVAGVGIGGAGGSILGAVLGAMAGVVAGCVPTFRETIKQRDEARARLRAAGELSYSGAETGPSFLLRPDRAIVEFAGRSRELAELRAWRHSGADKSVRLVIGPGGVGKTRLALEVAAGWRAEGREWLLIAAGREADAMAAVRGATSDPVLLVVDYAETPAALGELLRAVLDDPGRVRVLLLARSRGEWWDRLAEESVPAVGRLLREAALMQLAAPITAELSDAEVGAAAVPFFARELGVPAPASVVFKLPNRRVWRRRVRGQDLTTSVPG